MRKVYWKTKDGKVLDVDDMDITHLRNVLKMIIRNNQKPKQSFTLNGDIAQDFNDSWANHDEAEEYYDQWYYNEI